MTISPDLDYLASLLTPAFRPAFRGSVIEYAQQVDLQGHYSVKGQLDLATLRHLHGPLEAFQDPNVRVITIQGAVQTTKSLILDLLGLYIIEHEPGDLIWYLETDPKAKLYADEREMPMIYAKPEIAAMLEEVDRDDKTKTKIKFGPMTLQLCGLNITNTQTLSWRYVFIDEAWAARANGLIRHAMDRTKQYPDTHKIILVGQGGWDGDDFDAIHKQTDQRVLEYACPQCGYFQSFELSKLRGDDHPVEKLRGTYAGLSWDTNETTKPNGRWDFEAVGKTAHHRCYLCDFRIEETPENRRKLNDSYRYRATNPGAQQSMVGFQWPGEASMRVKFSDLVIKYLRAKVAMDELSYKLPMQEYYQKDRGLTWTENAETQYKTVPLVAYDAKSDWQDEAHRFLIADCQHGLTKFHVGVFACAFSGETRELARETVDSFDAIAKLQADWKVHDQRVFLDCGYEMTEVLRECHRRGHEGWKTIGGRRVNLWLCWTGLKGSAQETFSHSLMVRDRRLKAWVRSGTEQRIYSPEKWYHVSTSAEDSSKRVLRVRYYEFSNLHCKDLLRARRDADPGAPRFLFLPDTLPKEDQWSHWAQMRSEHRTARPGGKPIWEPISKNNPKPNHEWDKCSMLMAVQAIFGIIGSAASTPEPESQPLESVVSTHS
jgi:hypothetical protein